MTMSVTLRVQSVRSQNPFGRGGCIFVGSEISQTGDIVDAKRYYVVKATGAQLGEARVQPGQWWAVSGEPSTYVKTTNGYEVKESQITADSIALLRPSGEHIIAFLAECDDFQGIGMVKARRLWDRFGEGLYDLLDSCNTSELSSLLTPESAKQVTEAWAKQGSTRTLQWLQSSGIDVRTGHKLLAFFGGQAYEKLEEDPYRLLSFSASWKNVDAFARSRFHVAENDPRRLQAAVEEALYRLFDDGHTVCPMPAVMKRVESVLGGSSHRSLVMSALETGLSNGSYVIGNSGNVHLLGALIMERTVARSLVERIEVCAPLLDVPTVNALIADYENAEGFALNAEQRLAVQSAAQNGMALILGGAGVGKTTVLKALYSVYDAAGVSVLQMALSGRAAQRMTEATGRPSSTLARFFRHAQDVDFEGPAVVVVDEASMVDIITMHRLCELLPPHVRLLLVGDTSQLMPVGPGLVLHALAKIPEIPVVELTQVKRYGGAIAAAASDIRAGRWPQLSSDGALPISFMPCKAQVIPDVVVALYEEDQSNTQILSARKGNADGVQNLNSMCQARFTKHNRALTIHNDEFDMLANTGFHLGDPVLCIKNMWDQGLQNGSIGRLAEIEDKPRILSRADGSELGRVIAWVVWDDGERRPVFEEMLEHLELGYALTVHKSQGSQWPRVIVVLTGSRMLDRTLIYTAITRAQSQVIIIGDETAAREAVEALPKADLRQVGLHSLLESEIVARPRLARASA